MADQFSRVMRDASGSGERSLLTVSASRFASSVFVELPEWAAQRMVPLSPAQARELAAILLEAADWYEAQE